MSIKVKYSIEELRKLVAHAKTPTKVAGIGTVQDFVVFDAQLSQRADNSISQLKIFCVPFTDKEITDDMIQIYVVSVSSATEQMIHSIVKILREGKVAKIRTEVLGNRVFSILEVQEVNNVNFSANIVGTVRKTQDEARVWIDDPFKGRSFLISDLTLKGALLCGSARTDGTVYAVFGKIRERSIPIVHGLHFQVVQVEEKKIEVAEQKAEEKPVEQAEGSTEQSEELSEEEIERIQEEHVKKALGDDNEERK